MAKRPKVYALRADQFEPLAENRGGCYATDMITVESCKVGYMYREDPEGEFSDSGWRFFAGRESEGYANDPDNVAIYDVNTIANYDPDIVPFLDAPIGSAFEREGGTGPFVPIEDE